MIYREGDLEEGVSGKITDIFQLSKYVFDSNFLPFLGIQVRLLLQLEDISCIH